MAEIHFTPVQLVRKNKDITGTRIGRLTVLSPISKDSGGRIFWLCRCDCGTDKIFRAGHLKTGGNTKSCGCLHREFTSDRASTHGMTGSSEFKIWSNIIQRCTNPKDKGFCRYGGRGIEICSKWKGSFDAFYADMGPRPSIRHSIERINNDLGYSPDNCRWATMKEQGQNRSTTISISIGGRTQSAKAWADEYGLNYYTVWSRIKSGWPHIDALTTPPTDKYKPRH